MLGIPAIIAFISDFISDISKECIPPLIVGGLLLLNAVLLDISIYAVIIPYTVIIGAYLYVYLVFIPARQRIMLSLSTGLPYVSQTQLYIDQIIVLLSYNGIRQTLCKCNLFDMKPYVSQTTHATNLVIDIIHDPADDDNDNFVTSSSNNNQCYTTPSNGNSNTITFEEDDVIILNDLNDTTADTIDDTNHHISSFTSHNRSRSHKSKESNRRMKPMSSSQSLLFQIQDLQEKVENV